ncbi:AAA family ATPase [Paraburkholderia sediminicola]|uniref:AAA family ATPase n=1 Tax=Paraburkholderia sediminicola TaxID=458836 RepID=UPI0038BBB8FB
MSELASYVFSPLRKGDLALYRGFGNGLAPVLLVTATDASLTCLKRLEHEYALREDLDASWSARPRALSYYKDRVALVLEDPGGAPLDGLLLGHALEVTEFLRIAIALVGALRQVHERGLVHKDIKPGNVLVNLENGKAWLTGFGIAGHLPRERQNPAPPEMIAGTLAYMAPEQTGRMNRSVDSRSDLYALGVTFYEMLTGTLPFSAADPMEWIHCHIARQPTPLDEYAAIPATLSAIVMRLLAKTAEDRYQTAAGIEADLHLCQAHWDSYGRIGPFAVGGHDASDRLVIPERLYGREREIDDLLTAFDRVVAHGMPELVLVSGYSGIGKSSVVNELHKVLVPPRGLFASGKFDQYKRDIPYATLAQAFQSLLRPLLSHSEVDLSPWRVAFREALGPHGQFLVNLVPELELVIGQQPSVPELPPHAEKTRFQMVFRRFLSVFARKEHPLTLFLDDLQWLDSATLELVGHLMTHSEVRHLLLVGAYRDNEVGPAHPLHGLLRDIRSTGAQVHELVLAPLEVDDIGRLAADALHCRREHAKPLAQLLQDKTGGNPFFAIQFLTNLAEENLLSFDPLGQAWRWDIERIRAMRCTDNVVDLVARKLMRLSATTQAALKQLACLGNVVDIAMLALVHGASEETLHAALWEAVQAGLLLREGSTYTFLHDRVQQAAYSTISPQYRNESHLRIGRLMLANMTAAELAEHLFDVANQLIRGAELIKDLCEKAQVAMIDLRAGRRAKASAAYASACVYLRSGMSLLDDQHWSSQYDLMFGLWLECATCEFLTGNFDKAEQLISELLQRSSSNADRAAVYCLKIRIHIVKGENPRAVTDALSCLRLFDIDMPAHPDWNHVEAAYQTVWQTLGARPIESLTDLPLMTDIEQQAAMQVLSVLTTAAYFTDLNLYRLQVCHMVNIATKYGTSGASAHAYAYFASGLGPVFDRYDDAYRFAKLACDLVEKHGFIAYHARVYYAMGTVSFWSSPASSAIDFMRMSVRQATETGDLDFACYSMLQSITGLLLRSDPLDAVWSESEMVLSFTQETKYGDAVDMVHIQQRFIANMQGRTPDFSAFSDAQFDEAAFEAKLETGEITRMVACWYWIFKLKARFLSSNYIEALAASGKAQEILWALAAQIQMLDYFYYTALTVAALFDEASVEQQASWRDLMNAHQTQLRTWADHYPPTFHDKHALVSAEIARLDQRDLEAMRLYEQAIQSAHEHGFVQHEGVAHEVAARFYAARGFDTSSHAYLRKARYCYLRWGALGKVRQLDERSAHGPEEFTVFAPTATIGTPTDQLDLGTVVKASQAVSGEIEQSKLIETLLRITIEHAGAERGLLIRFHGDKPQIEAEATTGRAKIDVTLRQAPVTSSDLPDSVLHYMSRTCQSVILTDALAPSLFSTDPYVKHHRPRSVLCLPLVKQGQLIGALYLENNLTSHAFTAARIAVLELLASQAAISLENARLYSDLQHSEAFLARAQSISSTGSIGWNASSRELYWSDETYRIFEYDRTEKLTLERVLERVHPDDRKLVAETIERASSLKSDFDVEHRLLMKDGTVKHLHVIAHTIQNSSGSIEFFGALMDITEQKWAQAERARLEQRLRQAEKMEAVGRLAGGIAHDFNNVLAGVFAYGEMILEETPLNSALKRYAQNVLTAASRGRDLVEQILAYSRSQRSKHAPVDVAHIVAETLELIRGSLPATICLKASAPALPLIVNGNATQLHQIVMNLCSNAIQAIGASGCLRVTLEVAECSGEKTLSHGTLGPGHYVCLIVEDDGCGMDDTTLARIFEPFFTTKEIGQGTGLGLSLVYAIIIDSGGAIDVKSAPQQGSSFTIYLQQSAFMLDAAQGTVSGPP